MNKLVKLNNMLAEQGGEVNTYFRCPECDAKIELGMTEVSKEDGNYYSMVCPDCNAEITSIAFDVDCDLENDIDDIDEEGEVDDSGQEDQ